MGLLPEILRGLVWMILAIGLLITASEIRKLKKRIAENEIYFSENLEKLSIRIAQSNSVIAMLEDSRIKTVKKRK